MHKINKNIKKKNKQNKSSFASESLLEHIHDVITITV